MAITCLRYLSFEEFASVPVTQDVRNDIKKGRVYEFPKYPFLRFSAEYWPDFIRWAGLYSKSEELWQLFCDVSQSERRISFVLFAYRHTTDSKHDHLRFSNKIQKASALSAASYIGLLEFVSRLLHDKTLDTNAKCHLLCGCSPIEIAASRSHKSIVKDLAEYGANVNPDPQIRTCFGSAIQVAAVRRNSGIILLLIEKGADVNAQGGHYGFALHAAARIGYGDIVQLLVENGADINAQGGRFGCAIQAAVIWGYADVVQFLFANGDNPNIYGGIYGTSLNAAETYGHKAIAQFLLKNGADANMNGEWRGIPRMDRWDSGEDYCSEEYTPPDSIIGYDSEEG
jgi:hypothetical protein